MPPGRMSMPQTRQWAVKAHHCACATVQEHHRVAAMRLAAHQAPGAGRRDPAGALVCQNFDAEAADQKSASHNSASSRKGVTASMSKKTLRTADATQGASWRAKNRVPKPPTVTRHGVPAGQESGTRPSPGHRRVAAKRAAAHQALGAGRRDPAGALAHQKLRHRSRRPKFSTPHQNIRRAATVHSSLVSVVNVGPVASLRDLHRQPFHFPVRPRCT